MTRTMTDAELANSIRYLNGQLAYYDGETPITDADREMIRERNDYLRVAKERGLQI